MNVFVKPVALVAHPQHASLLFKWFLLLTVGVLGMILIGGLTRLTDSGLSMTEWRLFYGILPPLSDGEWQRIFALYQKTPEFKLKHFFMDIHAFKQIFWLEYIHRVAGRVMGLIFLLPFLYFCWQKMIRRSLLKRIVIMFSLGATQASFGWWMVESGFRDAPNVNPFWLSLHLGTAFIILSILFKTALDIYYINHRIPTVSLPSYLRTKVYTLPVVIFFQVLLGGMVAGNDAGLIYNQFPKMNEQWFASEIWSFSPWYHNFFLNHGMIQLQHRLGAYIVFLLVSITLLIIWRKNNARSLSTFGLGLWFILLLQMITGVLTLIYVVPVSLASIHQMLAAFLFLFAIGFAYRLYYGQSHLYQSS